MTAALSSLTLVFDARDHAVGRVAADAAATRGAVAVNRAAGAATVDLPGTGTVRAGDMSFLGRGALDRVLTRGLAATVDDA